MHQKILTGKSWQIQESRNEAGKTIMGVLKLRTFEGILLIKYVVVRMASLQCIFLTFIENNKDQATSKRRLFFLSATPFCCGVSTHDF